MLDVDDCGDVARLPPGEEVCNTSQYQCATGHCIPEAWMCDGEADCDDRTDELNCAPGGVQTIFGGSGLEPSILASRVTR
jgi:hypothetical protein